MKTIVIAEIELKIEFLREEANKLEESLNNILSNVSIHDTNSNSKVKKSTSGLLTLKQDDKGTYFTEIVKQPTKKKTKIQIEKEERVFSILNELELSLCHFKHILECYSLFESPTSSEAKSLRKALDIMLEDGTLTKDTTGKAHIYSIVEKN